MVNRSKNLLLISLLFLFLSLLSCQKSQPTSDDFQLGGIKGRIEFYGVEPNSTIHNIAFVSTILFTSMPNMYNFISYLGNYIVQASNVKPDHTYWFSNLPNGEYYVNIGPFDDEPDTTGEVSPFPYMSYHSTEPVSVDGDTVEIPDILMLPGGKSTMQWVVGQSTYKLQGFNFDLMKNVSTIDSADVWFDGANEMLITQGMNIVSLPSEPEGLCYITVAPDSGYNNSLLVPISEGGKHFVIRTRNNTYVKARIVGMGQSGSGESVTRRKIIFQWLHQPDGSKQFSY